PPSAAVTNESIAVTSSVLNFGFGLLLVTDAISEPPVRVGRRGARRRATGRTRTRDRPSRGRTGRRAGRTRGSRLARRAVPRRACPAGSARPRRNAYESRRPAARRVGGR